MMKIEKVVGDLILLVLDNHEPLKKIGIDQDKISVKVEGYDENLISHLRLNNILVLTK